MKSDRDQAWGHLSAEEAEPMFKAESMENIAKEIRVCVECDLWKGRKNAVPGQGNIDAVVAS